MTETREYNIKAVIHKCRAPETGYWAEVPSLPGCVTQGETLEEVREMISDAVRGWLQCAWELSMKARRNKTTRQKRSAVAYA